MGKTSIEWATDVWNPVRGCSRVSEGCRNCYAERQAARFAKPAPLGQPETSGNRNGPFFGFVTKVNGHAAWTGKVKLIHSHLHDPLRWREHRRVFVNSMSDLFHEDLSINDIALVFATMAEASQHDFLVLTKRAQRMREGVEEMRTRIAMAWETFDGGQFPWPLPNVWLGVSVEDRQNKERIEHLRNTKAAIRFLSIEPLLEDIGELDLRGIHWVIVGFESGPGARPGDLQWARNIIQQCRVANVACFFKQAGARPYVLQVDLPKNTRAWPYSKQFPEGDRIYTKLADNKGGNLDELPCDLCVREFPEVRGA